MNYTISGSTGFIGVHIIHHLLKNGHSVKALKRPSGKLNEYHLIAAYYKLPSELYKNLHWIDCELYDTEKLSESLRDTDVLVHTAGYISYLKKDKPKLLHTNVYLSECLINAALHSGVKKICFISSTAAISKSSGEKNIDENRHWDHSKPHSYYGFSKHLAELAFYAAAEEGLDMCIINPGIVLGYGNWNKGSLKLFRNAYRQFPFFSSGVTGFVGVEDMASFIVRLSESPIKNERYILVSENLSFADVARLMAKKIGKKPPYIEIKGWLYSFTKNLIWLKEMLGFGGIISSETVRAAITKNYFNHTKSKEALNFEYTPIEEVIANACDSYLSSRQ